MNNNFLQVSNTLARINGAGQTEYSPAEIGN